MKETLTAVFKHVALIGIQSNPAMIWTGVAIVTYFSFGTISINSLRNYNFKVDFKELHFIPNKYRPKKGTGLSEYFILFCYIVHILLTFLRNQRTGPYKTLLSGYCIT